jgi:hypothetical protein
MKRKYIFLLLIASIVGLIIGCEKESMPNRNPKMGSGIVKISSLNGKWEFEEITKEKFVDSQSQAFRKLAKKIKTKANLANGIAKFRESQPILTGENLDVPANFNFVMPAQEPDPDPLPTPEEIEVYMDEEIATEYFESVKYSIINFSYSYLGLDLTAPECYGTSEAPGIMRSGVMLYYCQDIESLGFCLDSVAMGLVSGAPLKTGLTASEAGDCLLDAIGLSATITAAGLGTYALVVTKQTFKKFIATAFPYVGAVAGAIMLAKFTLCCINNAAD